MAETLFSEAMTCKDVIKWLQEDETLIHRKAQVSPDAGINGPVMVENGAIVKSDVFIEGPVYIGQDSYIENKTTIKASYLGPDVCIGHCSRISGSILRGENIVGKQANLSGVELKNGQDIRGYSINYLNMFLGLDPASQLNTGENTVEVAGVGEPPDYPFEDH